MSLEEKYELEKLQRETAQEDVGALIVAIKNIRYALHTLNSSCCRDGKESLILAAAIGIVDAATLHLITHDDLLIEPHESLILIKQEIANAAANGDAQLYKDLKIILRRMNQPIRKIPLQKQGDGDSISGDDNCSKNKFSPRNVSGRGC